MSGRNWHLVRVAELRNRVANAGSFMAPFMRRSGPEISIPPYVVQRLDTRGQPISLPKVSIVERYNEDGTERRHAAADNGLAAVSRRSSGSADRHNAGAGNSDGDRKMAQVKKQFEEPTMSDREAAYVLDANHSPTEDGPAF